MNNELNKYRKIAMHYWNAPQTAKSKTKSRKSLETNLTIWGNLPCFFFFFFSHPQWHGPSQDNQKSLLEATEVVGDYNPTEGLWYN